MPMFTVMAKESASPAPTIIMGALDPSLRYEAAAPLATARRAQRTRPMPEVKSREFLYRRPTMPASPFALNVHEYLATTSIIVPPGRPRLEVTERAGFSAP